MGVVSLRGLERTGEGSAMVRRRAGVVSWGWLGVLGAKGVCLLWRMEVAFIVVVSIWIWYWETKLVNKS